MKKWLRILLWSAAAIAVVVVIAFRLNHNKEQSEKEIKKELVAIPFTVSAAKVKMQTFDNSATYRGTIEPQEVVGIFSETEGKLQQVNLEKGRTLRRGELVALLDRTIKTSNRQINQANYEKARSDYERLSELFAENNASRIEVENARVQMQTLASQLTISDKELDQGSILSPASGIVIEKKVNQGEYVQAGAVLATIADLHIVLARVFVPEQYIPLLKTGMKTEVKADVYPGRSFQGIIKTILPVANEARSFPVEIVISNRLEQRLFAGMSVSVRFSPLNEETMLTVPRTALAGDIKTPLVYVIDSNKKPVKRAILLGRDFGTNLEVIKGLKEGEIVVTSGQSNIELGKVLSKYSITD